MMKNNIKQQLFNHCLDHIHARLKTIQSAIEGLQESLNSETKSTAGDKHETGRAMLQLEREQAGQQLFEAENIKATLLQIDITKVSKTVVLGSLVYTSQFNYFVSISAGAMTVNNEVFYAVSLQTPIAQLLLGKQIGDEIIFRNQHFSIKAIL